MNSHNLNITISPIHNVFFYQNEQNVSNTFNFHSLVCFKIIYIVTRKRFSEKPIVAFTNSTVFALDFNVC